MTYHTFFSGGIFGSVSVLVRTVGGGEDWTSQIVPRPGASGNDTITQVLGNRDRFTSAVGGTDYVVLDTKVDFKVSANNDRECNMCIDKNSYLWLVSLNTSK